jgi:hypothetical protein
MMKIEPSEPEENRYLPSGDIIRRVTSPECRDTLKKGTPNYYSPEECT